jgi:carbonic anhydrase/acetyltransferase-like protein (isoleucine patch superfamily)
VIEAFDGKSPVIHPRAWVHPSAVVIGEVVLAEGVSIWPTTVLRGDMGPIRIGRDSNVQDGSVCHDTTDWSETVVGERVTIGHRVVLHGCCVEDDCLVGMGSVVLDRAVIGRGSFVAAGSLVTPGTVIPPGSFARGSPARVVREVNDRDREMIATGWKSYRDRLRIWLGG